jgi:nucleoside-diphosphate-sugar epimerase
MEMQMGNVPTAYAKTDLLNKLTGYKSSISISEGVSMFIDWYLSCTGQFK